MFALWRDACLLRFGTPGLRESAAGRIAKWNRQAVDVLGRASRRDSSAAVRRATIFSLGRLSDPRSVDYLAWALQNDSDDQARQWAAESLARVGDPAAIPYFLAFLPPDDAAEIDDVGLACAKGLASFKDLRAAGPLAKGMIYKKGRWETFELRAIDAATSLAHLLYPSASSRLDAYIGQSRAFDPLYYCRELLSTMCSLGAKPSIGALIDLLRRGSPKATIAAILLGNEASAEAIPALSSALESEDFLTATAAKGSLVSIKAIQALVQASASDLKQVALLGIAGLRDIRYNEVGPFRRALAHRDDEVCRSALHAICDDFREQADDTQLTDELVQVATVRNWKLSYLACLLIGDLPPSDASSNALRSLLSSRKGRAVALAARNALLRLGESNIDFDFGPLSSFADVSLDAKNYWWQVREMKQKCGRAFCVGSPEGVHTSIRNCDTCGFSCPHENSSITYGDIAGGSSVSVVGFWSCPDCGDGGMC